MPHRARRSSTVRRSCSPAARVGTTMHVSRARAAAAARRSIGERRAESGEVADAECSRVRRGVITAVRVGVRNRGRTRNSELRNLATTESAVHGRRQVRAGAFEQHDRARRRGGGLAGEIDAGGGGGVQPELHGVVGEAERALKQRVNGATTPRAASTSASRRALRSRRCASGRSSLRRRTGHRADIVEPAGSPARASRRRLPLDAWYCRMPLDAQQPLILRQAQAMGGVEMRCRSSPAAPPRRRDAARRAACPARGCASADARGRARRRGSRAARLRSATVVRSRA